MIKFKILLLLTTFLASFAIASSDNKARKISNSDLPTLSEFLNSYSSYGELINDYEFLGIVSHADANGLRSDLKEQNISLTSLIPQFKITKNKLISGSCSWTAKSANEIVYSNSGLVIDSTMPLHDFFLKAMSGCNSRVSKSWLLPEANAASDGNKEDSAASAIGAVTWKLAKVGIRQTFMTVVDGVRIVGSGAELIIGTGAFLAAYPISLFRKAGSIRCDEGNYTFGDKTRLIPEEEWQKMRSSTNQQCLSKGEFAAMNGHYPICRLAALTGEYYTRGLAATGHSNGVAYVPNQIVSAAFAPNQVLTCNSERANKLRDFIKSQIESSNVCAMCDITNQDQGARNSHSAK